MLYHDSNGRLQLARERAAELARDYERRKSRAEPRGDAQARRPALAALLQLLRRDRAGQGSASRA